ncbi:uncharacterized protein C8Q71DRAFT_859593 [Rhodofomes roseus]|uniref:DUF6533 domain-containing protein n=1 Tax=Rhodofomes roseus TaxID=34475 RepID=A0ABQ8KB72_9APHY|nr:uncharacterized protein C8Q71DRAFT_859593 [Rhodofomes roseus]KAH9834628.1 hypothetical protein C8Q71DRAFT_859593 [Rhodofomes roseus]
MSTPSTEVISVIGYHIIQNYFEIAAAGLLLYDLAITLDEELQYMWLFRPPSMLFLLNRIDMLAIVSIVLFDMVTLLNLLLWTAVSSLRVYAVSNRNRFLTVISILFGLIPFIVNLFGAAQDSIVLYPLAQFGLCATTNHNSPTTSIRAGAIGSDALVVLVIWYFLSCASTRFRNGSAGSSLSLILVRNGTLYFIVLLLVNILDLALVVTSALYVSSSSVIQAYNPLPVTIFPITSIIIARFTLDLRKLAAEAQNLESSKVVPLSNADEWQFMTSPMKPYKSIVRWNRECLDADPDMPAGFASVTGFTDDVEREGDAEMQVVHRVSLNA